MSNKTELNNGKVCAYGKKPEDDFCGGTCLRHYKCRSCGNIHVRKGK